MAMAFSRRKSRSAPVLIAKLMFSGMLPVALANLMAFFADESCGQCTPCRVGTEKMLGLLRRDQWDEAQLRSLSQVMMDASICGLGQAAPNPVLGALDHFRDRLASQGIHIVAAETGR